MASILQELDFFQESLLGACILLPLQHLQRYFIHTSQERLEHLPLQAPGG